MGLNVTLERDDWIEIGDPLGTPIVVRFLGRDGNRARMHIEAPRAVPVHRRAIANKIRDRHGPVAPACAGPTSGPGG